MGSRMGKIIRKIKLLHIDNKGTTLVEMIVCFLMLAIFTVAASALVTTMTSMYYQVKGETYGKQVADIVTEKIESEVEGADGAVANTTIAADGSSMTLIDRDGMKVNMYAEDGRFKINYLKIDESDKDSVWQFGKEVYNQYTLDKITFIKAENLGSNASLAADYGLTDISGYDKNVIVVLLKLSSDHYGDYYTYRFIRMYNADPNGSGGSPSNP